MFDKNEEVEIEEPIEGAEEVEVLELTPKEQEAYDKGWRPKDQWEGDEEDYKTAGEFLRHEKLYGNLASVKKDLRKMEQKYNRLKEGISKMTKLQLERTRKETTNQVEKLRQQKYRALEEQDHVTAEKINETIQKVEKELDKSEPEDLYDDEDKVTLYTADDFSAYYDKSWKKQNSWYESDADLKETADALMQVYYKKNPDTSPEELFDHVDSKMKKFVEKQTGKPKPKAAVASRSGAKSARKGKHSLSEIPSALREVAVMAISEMKRQGIENAEEVYLNDYFSATE